MKRSGKFYRNNEADVMKSLGLKPTINSGSGPIEKEDGQNEFIICQLKSTDAQSIRIVQKDIHTLEYNASVTHKLPVFAIQFLNTNEIYILVKPDIIEDVAKYLQTGSYSSLDNSLINIEDVPDTPVMVNSRVIKSSSKAKDKFKKELSKKYKKEKSAK